MEKKKNSKIKEYWNEKGKSLCLRILHIVCYVLSLGFIILCVYACANTNNKDNKQENDKKGLYLEQPKQLTINVDKGLQLSSIDEEWFNSYLIDCINSHVYEEHILLQNLMNGNFYYLQFVPISSEITYSLFIYSSIFDAPNNNLSLVYKIFVEGVGNSDIVYRCAYTTYSSGDLYFISEFSDYENDYDFNYFLSYLYSHNLLLFYDYINDLSYDDIYNNYIDYNYSNAFEGVSDSMTDYIDTIGKGLESSVEIFYDEDNSQLTAIGWLSVIVVSVGLSWSIFSIVSGLIRLRG